VSGPLAWYGVSGVRVSRMSGVGVKNCPQPRDVKINRTMGLGSLMDSRVILYLFIEISTYKGEYININTMTPHSI